MPIDLPAKRHLAERVGTRADGLPLYVTRCDTARHLALLMGSKAGLPYYAAAYCGPFRLGKRVGVRADGKPLYVFAAPCCGPAGSGSKGSVGGSGSVSGSGSGSVSGSIHGSLSGSVVSGLSGSSGSSGSSGLVGIPAVCGGVRYTLYSPMQMRFDSYSNPFYSCVVGQTVNISQTGPANWFGTKPVPGCGGSSRLDVAMMCDPLNGWELGITNTAGSLPGFGATLILVSVTGNGGPGIVLNFSADGGATTARVYVP